MFSVELMEERDTYRGTGIPGVLWNVSSLNTILPIAILRVLGSVSCPQLWPAPARSAPEPGP